jgi:predicted dehydrogenase
MEIDRREFIEKGTKLTLGISALGLISNSSFAAHNPGNKLRMALVGTGSRGSTTWGKDLLIQYADQLDMVALCDINPKRVDFAKRYIGTNAPVYLAKDFNRMIQETNPDAVIITTTDCFHEEYVIRAMELGCDVICEKPLVTEALQAQKLLDTEKRTGRKIITTFNARHSAYAEEIKKVLNSGTLGRIISAEYMEYLDIDHGASYFRRWHGKSRFSGTLLCHKASHHFDQLNWFLDAEPVEVSAFGDVSFYGKNNAFRGKNCRNCSFTDKCDFYWDISGDQWLTDMYVACENEDGYLRDGCVWDNEIDTFDTMTVEVKYNTGTILNYSLNAFLPYEGQRIAFNGQKGRLDVRIFQRQPWDPGHGSDFRLTHNFKETKTWHIDPSVGTHGGADKRLKDMLFLPGHKDPLGKIADSRAGILASLIGIAARQSIETEKKVSIADLIDFPVGWTFADNQKSQKQ